MNPYRHIEARSEGDVLVLRILEKQVREYIVAEELRYELVHVVKRSRKTKFILDLQEMEFMTSLACVAFIGVKHAVREVEGRLVLCNMAEFIRKILETKRLLAKSQHTGSVAFVAADSLEEAMESLQSDEV